MTNHNNNHKITINIKETSWCFFCNKTTDQNFVSFFTKQSNTQFQYSAQTRLSELKTSLSNILQH